MNGGELMKRRILAILLTMVMTATALGVIAHAQPQVGDRLGDVLNTDIRVFLNGIPIMGYNINGWTYVVAEDLPAYGKNVIWNPQTRTLSITMGAGSPMTPRPIPENFAPVGSVAFPFIHTDIVTYIAGQRVSSYNIQGQTVIRIDDLVAAFGVSRWDSVRRELLVATDGQGPRRPINRVYLEDGINRVADDGITRHPESGSFVMGETTYFRGIRATGRGPTMVWPSRILGGRITYNIAGRDFTRLEGILGRFDGTGGTVTITGDGRFLAGFEVSATASPIWISVDIPFDTASITIQFDNYGIALAEASFSNQ
jgi:hypothetical protein